MIEPYALSGGLSENQILRMHEKALSLVEEVGIHVPHDGILKLLSNYDSYCIPKNAPNPDAAYALCNELLAQTTQITGVADNLYCGVVTTDAIAKLNADQKALYPYDDLDKFFKQNILNGPIPLESTTYATFNDWVTMWEEVKAMN